MLLSDDMKRYGSYLSENIHAYGASVQEQLRQAAGRVGALTYDVVIHQLTSLGVVAVSSLAHCSSVLRTKSLVKSASWVAPGFLALSPVPSY